MNTGNVEKSPNLENAEQDEGRKEQRRERQRAYMRKYRMAHPQKSRKEQKRPHHKGYSREYYQAHKERICKYQREYVKRPYVHEKLLAYWRNRYADPKNEAIKRRYLAAKVIKKATLLGFKASTINALLMDGEVLDKQLSKAGIRFNKTGADKNE
jgi:hypothetical protein